LLPLSVAIEYANSSAKTPSVGIRHHSSDAPESDAHLSKRKVSCILADGTKRRIVVLGGTIAGIVTAVELQDKGYEVTLMVLGGELEECIEKPAAGTKWDVGLSSMSESLARDLDNEEISATHLRLYSSETRRSIEVNEDAGRTYKYISAVSNMEEWEAAKPGYHHIEQTLRDGHVPMSEWVQNKGIGDLVTAQMAIRTGRGFGYSSVVPANYFMKDIAIDRDFILKHCTMASYWREWASRLNHVMWNVEIARMNRGFSTVREGEGERVRESSYW